MIHLAGKRALYENTMLWIPGQRILIAGDVVVNNMHVYTAETDSKARGKWLNSLNKIRELKPSVVIPGHSKVGTPLDASTAVDFTENYLIGFDEELKKAKDPDKRGGHVIVSTFGPDGPTKCSGLEVMRYDTESLHGEFSGRFRLVESSKELHETPFRNHPAIPVLLLPVRMKSHRRIFRISLEWHFDSSFSCKRVGSALTLRGSLAFHACSASFRINPRSRPAKERTGRANSCFQVDFLSAISPRSP